MYRCSVESESESEHSNLIYKRARLILWQIGSICVLNTRFEHLNIKQTTQTRLDVPPPPLIG